MTCSKHNGIFAFASIKHATKTARVEGPTQSALKVFRKQLALGICETTNMQGGNYGPKH